MEIPLKYGANPHQAPARLVVPDPAPFRVLNGRPSYINILDALGAWQLVRELAGATGRVAAASFKHTSPAGAAVDGEISDVFRRSQFLPAADWSPAASAYLRARAGDRMSAFGDAAALSTRVDRSAAEVLRSEVSDLVVAPGYEPEALGILKEKKKGAYVIFEMDPDYEPAGPEVRDVFGLRLEQPRNDVSIGRKLFEDAAGTALPDDIVESLIVGAVALKYTQSNSVCVAYQGQVIGMGAGQQSRIHCTRLACDKADKWFLQQHPRVLALRFRDGIGKTRKANIVDQYLLWEQLTDPEKEHMLAGLEGDSSDLVVEHLTREDRQTWINLFDPVCLVSDAFIPFRDNIDRAHRSHVGVIAETGGSLREAEIREAAASYGMTLIPTGVRLFTH
jgi:AICAR transformylase/IMP cyclohydrolase PurH